MGEARLVVDHAELFGLAGRHLGRSGWLRIDQARIDRFAEATDDFQWIHVDRERAARELGHTIAHGFLTLSLIPRLAEELLEVRGVSHAFNMGSNRVRFMAPVPVDSELRLHQEVIEVSPRGAGTQLVSRFTIERKGADKPVCIAEQVALFLP